MAGNESARVYVRVLIEKSNGIDKRCMFIGLKCIVFWGVLVMFFAVVKIYSGQTSVESVKVTPGRRSARCCQKTEAKPDLFEHETVFAHWGSIPKCTELYLGVFLLSESEGTLLASAPSRPDVPALKELGVANSSVSRTVFKSASSLPFWYPVEMTAQCWQQYNVRTTGLSHLCYRESFN